MPSVLNIRLLCACLAAVLPGVWHSELCAGQRVVIELQDGEQLMAEVDARSSSQRLWLRYAYGSAEILRPIEWDRVARGVVGSDDLDAAAFRAKALQIRSLHEPGGAGIPARQAGKNARPPLRHQVQSIWADARLANWDADAPFDGLLLRVVPLDCHGDPVAATGTIEAELWDNRARFPRSLGRWTCAVEEQTSLPAARMATPLGFVHPLPFQADDPQVDDAISRLGTLRVSLAVPGQGVFEYEVSDVALRPFGQSWTAPFRTRTRTR